MNQTDLYNFIAGCKLAVLSTVSSSGVSQSALIGIAVTPELEIIFDTIKTSRKYPNLIATPRCSLVIGWEGERTVQYEGEAVELSGSEMERCRAVYFRTWPEGPSRLSWPGIVYFAVRPKWVRYSDFDQNPPAIQEFVL